MLIIVVIDLNFSIHVVYGFCLNYKKAGGHHMYQGSTIFSQIMDFFPMHHFRKCIERYDGNKGTRTFSCWDQFLCMAFAQLTYRESLRDIECCLRAMQKNYIMSVSEAKSPVAH
jgi:hypothetical protein